MVVLVRVDDRLIHGQVVEGWLRVLQPHRVLVVSDQAAGDSLQVSLMRLALPEGVALDVLSIEEASRVLRENKWGAERVIILSPGISEIRALVESGVSFSEINLGGLHFLPGRRMFLPHLGWTEEERVDLNFLLGRSIKIETRAVPTDPVQLLEELLGSAASLL